MIEDQRTAIGEMVHAAWCRGRWTGFLEGGAVGFFGCLGLLFVRYVL